MERTDAYAGLSCVDCETAIEPGDGTSRCPDCGDVLDVRYDYEAVDLSRERLADRPFETMWRYEELLPFTRESAVSMNEGATALVECPTLAEELGVGRVLLKDEGRNPTGTFKDRGATVAVTAAREAGATDVALASAGNAGQAAAAYAARAGIDSHVFLPSRAGFTNKAMVNVHGGDMTVVGGRIGDAAAAAEDALADHEDWHSLQSADTPYRRDGKKTMFFEIAEQLDWSVPDAIVYPTGGGVGLVGIHKGAREFRRLGLTDGLPSLYAAQSSGCAPIVDAWEGGRDRHDAWETPDTICGGIEIPDPTMSPLVLSAIEESDGGAVATPDEDILESATSVAAHEGVEMAPTSAAAASGAWELARRGEFDDDDTVVLLNTGTGNKDADVLRSHLMGQGI